MRRIILLMAVLLMFAVRWAGAESVPDFISVSGQCLIDAAGNPFVSRGIQFNNAQHFWDITLEKAKNDHDEASYAELADMGFNTIRFMIDIRLFQTDDGWEWMDENIDLARKYGMRLIPALMICCPVPHEDTRQYWLDAAVRQEYIDFWRTFAARYSEEPVILGYDLMNEPAVYVDGGDYTAAREMWIDHANEIIRAIREVNKRHLIFLEGVFSVVDTSQDPYVAKWHELYPEDDHHFLVDDDQTVYTFHYYNPSSFAMQDMDWYGSAGLFETYPNSLVWIIPEGVNTPAALPAGTTAQWTMCQSTYTAAEDMDITGHVILAANAIGTDATVWFDDVVLEEYDENMQFVRTVMQEDFEERDYDLFAPDLVGSSCMESNGGVNNSRCISVTGTIGRAFVVMDKYKMTSGYHYVLKASVRGENVAADAFATPEFDLYRLARDDEENGDRQNLLGYMAEAIRFGRENQVPMWMGEFGSSKATTEADRGAGRWTEDILELCAENGIHYSYYTYHDDWFGLWEDPSSEPRTKLVEERRDALIYGNNLSTTTVTVTFNGGGGTGVMKPQVFDRETTTALSACTFTRPGYRFTHWSTGEDGSGVCYGDGAEVALEKNLVLFAQWTSVPGDADDSGTVDSYDALLVLQYASGWDVTVNEVNADVTGDGAIGVADALKILQTCMGGDIVQAMRALQRMLADLNASSLEIIEQPADQYVPAGETAAFTVTATGDGLKYQWYIDRNDGNGWQKLINAVDAACVATKAEADTDGDQYRCVITDAHGNEATTAVAVLHVELELPNTGDASAPALWLAMCMLSVIGLMILKRRKEIE